MVSEAYKLKVLEWIGSHADGVTTFDLKVKFPRVPLREMEKKDRTIAYEYDRWIVVGQDQ